MDIRDELLPTTQQLNERWVKCYEQSEQAILRNPQTFQEILSIIDEVCFGLIDIDEYYDVASRLSQRLDQMGRETIFFNYFHEQIDPKHHGTARYFRPLCRDLSEQIEELNQWRKTRRCLRIVRYSPMENQYKEMAS
jgi:hypothetical protein